MSSLLASSRLLPAYFSVTSKAISYTFFQKEQWSCLDALLRPKLKISDSVSLQCRNHGRRQQHAALSRKVLPKYAFTTQAMSKAVCASHSGALICSYIDNVLQQGMLPQVSVQNGQPAHHVRINASPLLTQALLLCSQLQRPQAPDILLQTQ